MSNETVIEGRTSQKNMNSATVVMNGAVARQHSEDVHSGNPNVEAVTKMNTSALFEDGSLKTKTVEVDGEEVTVLDIEGMRKEAGQGSAQSWEEWLGRLQSMPIPEDVRAEIPDHPMKRINKVTNHGEDMYMGMTRIEHIKNQVENVFDLLGRDPGDITGPLLESKVGDYEDEDVTIIETRFEQQETPEKFVEDTSDDWHPIEGVESTNKDCEHCGSTLQKVELQTQAADESGTVFLACPTSNCDHTKERL